MTLSPFALSRPRIREMALVIVARAGLKFNKTRRTIEHSPNAADVRDEIELLCELHGYRYGE